MLCGGGGVIEIIGSNSVSRGGVNDKDFSIIPTHQRRGFAMVLLEVMVLLVPSWA